MNKGFAVYKTSLGYIYIGYENDRLTELGKAEKEVNGGKPNALTEQTYLELTEYLAGKRKIFTVPFTLKGTDFQMKVWNALCAIPYGETRSYKDIAVAVGSPKAFRAVGMANNKNPISIIVPCHRVIGADGSLVGYGGGLDMKTALLNLEKRGAGII